MHKKIEEILKENLVSLYSYDTSNLLIVVKSAPLNVLDQIQSIYKKLAGKLTVFTQAELENALDVFPIEFLEMQRQRTLLAGTDLLENVKISPSNLRHECEFYLRSNILKLREGYINKENPEGLITQSLPSFLKVLKFMKIDGLKEKPKSFEAYLEELEKIITQINE